MPEKTVYISYRPEQSLHIAQPLFNGLRRLDYDVFMDIEEGMDAVNIRQIGAREHFLMILTPGALANANRADDRLTVEFEEAVHTKRNMVLLLTRDFNFDEELRGVEGLLAHLPRIPSLRLQPKQLAQIVQTLADDHLQQSAKQANQPTTPEDAIRVTEKIRMAREYSQQTTIRLNTEKLFFRAVVKIRRGDFDGALNDLDLVIAENPHNESAYLQRARVLRKKGRKTAALKDYEQATRLSPKLVAAHIGRGELLLESGRSKQAYEAFQTALNLQAESAPAIAGMALAQFMLDNLNEAATLWGWLLDRDESYQDPKWAGEVFDWDDILIGQAAELIARLT